MKIKIKNRSCEEISALPAFPYKKPMYPNPVLGLVQKVLSFAVIKKNNVKFNEIGMEKLGKKEPCLILMNHSSFTDLKLASFYFFPRPLSIVCTMDALVGKSLLMRLLGCIPTKKFVSDLQLMSDMRYALRKLKSSVLLYPEAGYSFDGRATVIPDTMGKLLKFLKVPVVFVMAHGAFARDPLYNGLQLRKVDITMDVKLLYTAEDIKEKSAEELSAGVTEAFSFDNFKWQQENEVKIDEDFRADGLNRVLYKCPACNAEGANVGKGTRLKCTACGKEYELTEYGKMRAVNGETEFEHIPDWFDWQRKEVLDEIKEGRYGFEKEVDIYVLTDFKALYRIGDGVLAHGENGFTLKGCGGKLDIHRTPDTSYSLNADFFWYEIGDTICIENEGKLYYCFPKGEADIVTKTRLAAEELYKLWKKTKESARGRRASVDQ
ncbi:MAG: hypothetical protein E7665_01905 [Ruminococcaceae bacterium]|nr:hypothetical protein [Oscillospiraceae bacterium]